MVFLQQIAIKFFSSSLQYNMFMFYSVWFDYTQAYLLSYKVRLEL